MNSNSIFAPEPVVSVAPKVGDILVGFYGYEASIPTFAKVLSVNDKTVRVVELEGWSHSYKTGGMEWKVDVTDVHVGETMTKRFKPTKNGYKIKWSSYQNLCGPWTPVTCNAYNYH